MTTPVITSITPDTGRSLGVTFARIVGTDFNLVAIGTVRVFFDNQEAEEVQVISSTEIQCLTPRSILDTFPAGVDVKVENTTPQLDPNPPLVESDTLVAGFTYRRPSIATNDPANNACVVRITQALIAEFRRYVLENTHHDTHPEYVDLVSQAANEEKQGSPPSVKILGPQIQEDLFYREHGRIDVEVSPGIFETFDEPETVMLEYNYVCVGRSSGEVINLWEVVTKYFQKTTELVVPKDGVDPTNGFVTYEMGVINEQRADVRASATRQGIYQASGAFLLRGVPLLADKVGEGREVLDVLTQFEPLL